MIYTSGPQGLLFKTAAENLPQSSLIFEAPAGKNGLTGSELGSTLR